MSRSPPHYLKTYLYPSPAHACRGRHGAPPGFISPSREGSDVYHCLLPLSQVAFPLFKDISVPFTCSCSPWATWNIVRIYFTDMHIHQLVAGASSESSDVPFVDAQVFLLMLTAHTVILRDTDSRPTTALFKLCPDTRSTTQPQPIASSNTTAILACTSTSTSKKMLELASRFSPSSQFHPGPLAPISAPHRAVCFISLQLCFPFSFSFSTFCSSPTACPLA